MPQPWDEATFRRAFCVRVRHSKAKHYGQVVTYSRRFAEIAQEPPGSFYRDRAQWLYDAFKARGLTRQSRVLVCGAGFGFLVHELRQLGADHVWGVDASPYVESRYALEAPCGSLVVFRDITKLTRTELRDALITFTGDWQFDGIVTETLLEGISVVAAKAVFNTLELALTSSDTRRIVHLVHCATAHSRARGLHDTTLGLHWRTLDEWAALRPGHTWIDWASGEVR